MIMMMIITMLLIQNTDGQSQFALPSTLPITWNFSQYPRPKAKKPHPPQTAYPCLIKDD